MHSVYLSGFGSRSPEKRLTNKALEAFVDTTDEWIVARTGIHERHVMAPEENVSDLAVAAARVALTRAGLAPEDITHTLVATCTPELLCPSTACIVARKLDIAPAMAFDFSAACSGFVYGLKIGAGLLAMDPQACVLLVGVEGLSRRLNWLDRGTSVLFGDGAGAGILTASPREGLCARVVDTIYATDGSKSDLITVGGGTTKNYVPGDPVDGDFFVAMQGREVFKHAVRNMTAVSKQLLENNGMAVDNVDLFVPHQANLRIIEAVGERLSIPAERVFVNVESHGNTSAASIPLALAEAVEQGRIEPGMTVLLTTFGSGFTWGAALLQF